MYYSGVQCFTVSAVSPCGQHIRKKTVIPITRRKMIIAIAKAFTKTKQQQTKQNEKQNNEKL